MSAVLTRLERLDRTVAALGMQRSPEQDEAWGRCSADPAHFLRHYAKVSDPETLQTLDFQLWPHLAYLLDLWQRERLCIVLKARQLGVSWLLAGYALWKAKFRPQANVLLLSKNQVDAADLLAKARFIEGALPEWLQSPLGKDNASELEFPARGARVRALPSTPNAGRGNTASLVIPDEFAFHEYARPNYVALMPTLGSRGQMLIVSTASGLANLYEELWRGADPARYLADRGDDDPRLKGVWTLPNGGTGPNGFAPVFLHWSCRPGRDQDWVEAQQALYDDPKLFHQEFPSNPSEAFLTSGSLVFDSDALDAVFAPGIPQRAIAAGLTVYHEPKPRTLYMIGADVAQGLAHADASCAVVLDAESYAEVAHYHTNSPPDVFAAGLHTLATNYPGVLAVERNGPGHQVLYKLRELRTNQSPYRLYVDTAVLKTPARAGEMADAGLPGWVTTGKNKPTMIGELEEATRKEWVTIRSRLAYEQMRMYQRSANGETGAPPTKHDDCVIAWAIAWQMHKWVRAAHHQRRGPLVVSGLRA